jgi:hypothetical protein
MTEPDRKIFVESADEIAAAAREGFSGIYAGSSFCQDALPEPDALAGMIAAALDLKLSFHLVTPFLTESGFDRAARLAETLAARAPGAEVSANDLGFLATLASDFTALVPVAGVTLAHQRTDPLIPQILAAAFPGAELESRGREFGRVSADNPAFAGFLKSLRVERLEVQNPLQGVRLEDRGIKYSLHVPYVCVAATRFCPPYERYTRRGRTPGVYECRKWCADRSYRIAPPGGASGGFILRGNAVFYENPPGTPPRGVDRIVVHRRPS